MIVRILKAALVAGFVAGLVTAVLQHFTTTPLIAAGIPDPAMIPPEFNVIMPERCAEIALKGLDLGLFYIPTHAHIGEDIRPRFEGVQAAIKALGLN